MGSLYDIERTIAECVDYETGEIIDIEKLDALEMEREHKVENILLYIKNLKAEAEAIKVEKQNLADRQKVAENKAESLVRYIQSYLNGEKFKTARVAVSYRKSESVEVDDISLVPEQYLVFKEPTADKTAIKQAIKSGESISGCTLIEKQNMQIK